jgi:hypothetical protein
MATRESGRHVWDGANHALVTTFTVDSANPVWLDLEPAHTNPIDLAYFCFESHGISSEDPDGGRPYVAPYSSDPSLAFLASTHWNFDYPELNYTAYWSTSPSQLRIMGDPDGNAFPSPDNDWTVHSDYYYDTALPHTPVVVRVGWSDNWFEPEPKTLRKYGGVVEVTVYELWFDPEEPDPGGGGVPCAKAPRTAYPYTTPRAPSANPSPGGVRRSRRRVL